MCDTWDPEGNPLSNSKRSFAKELFDKKLEEIPWFGIEQEYFLVDPQTQKPLGFSLNGYPCPQGQYYCASGPLNVFRRDVAEAHLQACIYAGLKISGINAEVAPGQWEYQIGPCVGIEAGDHHWLSRYLLVRVAEQHNLIIDFDPKPVEGDWNGSGCHTNFSTEGTRHGANGKTGLDIINECMKKLETNHVEHMKNYGSGNERRMTGAHETASFEKFNYGIGNRACSVRIGTSTAKAGKGFFEDRRPSSNMDPYLVTGLIFKTCCLE